MAAKYDIGKTIYVDGFRAKLANHKGYKGGLATVVDPAGVPSHKGRTSYGYLLVEYHGGSRGHSWVPEALVRYARPNDFQEDDIIRENVLGICDMKILEIHTVALNGVGNAPIEAEMLEEDGMGTGNIFFLEPEECILVQRSEFKETQREGPAPKNNDGRKRCWWCDMKTFKSQGFHLDWYDMCPKCKK